MDAYCPAPPALVQPFLLLADLLSRVLLRPLELPVGAVTSLVGAGAFVYIFYTTRRKNQGC